MLATFHGPHEATAPIELASQPPLPPLACPVLLCPVLLVRHLRFQAHQIAMVTRRALQRLRRCSVTLGDDIVTASITPTPPVRTALLAPKMLLLAALIAAAGPWSRADFALVLGIALALCGVSVWSKESKFVSKWLIQACVVLLGFRLDLNVLAESAISGLALAVGTIVGAIAIGLLLGKLLRTGREISTLVTSGTAICGGSAIVAIGASIGASTSNMAVATGAIFMLNAIGLWTLPAIGHALGLTEVQFGQWAGVALHDIASVGGAAKEYGAEAFDTATIVKLTRVIWITPLAILAGRFMSDHTATGKKSPFPWFILVFLGASACRTALPQMKAYEGNIAFISGIGFQIALFLIGTGLSRSALKSVGWRALVQAAVLWIVLAGGSLIAIRWMVV